MFLGFCGPRVGEALALQRRDIDLVRGTASISKKVKEVGGRMVTGPTKTGTKRLVPLPQFVAEALAEHLRLYVAASPEAPVFTSTKNLPLRPQDYRQDMFYPAYNRARLPTPPPTVHDLRHTAASIAFDQGATVVEVSQMLGHATPAVTMQVYAHLLPSAARALSERMEAAYRQVRTGEPRSRVIPFPVRHSETIDAGGDTDEVPDYQSPGNGPSTERSPGL